MKPHIEDRLEHRRSLNMPTRGGGGTLKMSPRPHSLVSQVADLYDLKVQSFVGY